MLLIIHSITSVEIDTRRKKNWEYRSIVFFEGTHQKNKPNTHTKKKKKMKKKKKKKKIRNKQNNKNMHADKKDVCVENK